MEFQEVMRQGARLCNAHDCGNCPLHNCCPTVMTSFVREGKHIMAEEIITQWAKDNPEPVYPTWYEYFRSMGMGSATGGYIADWVLTTRIPADTAKILGLEPKVVMQDGKAADD